MGEAGDRSEAYKLGQLWSIFCDYVV